MFLCIRPQPIQIFRLNLDLCENLPTINNGQLHLNESHLPPFDVGEEIPYHCDNDYRSEQLRPKVTCTLSQDNVANWTGGSCIRKIAFFFISFDLL